MQPVTKVPSPGKADFAQQTHDYIRDQIKFADQKAAFVFTASSALLALLYSKGFHSRWFHDPKAADSLSSLVAMVALVAAAGFSASVVVPRRKGSPRGYIFWASIAAYKTSTDYVAAVSALSDADVTSERLHHCHELACICRRKYAVLDRGLWLAAIGCGAALVSLLLL